MSQESSFRPSLEYVYPPYTFQEEIQRVHGKYTWLKNLLPPNNYELFSYISEKLENQVRNEIFRQMSLTLTLPLDVPVRPVDAKGLSFYGEL